jgi:hypothetical protein
MGLLFNIQNDRHEISFAGSCAMRIYLDTKDLIDLLERSQPMTAEAFSACLCSNAHRVVVSFHTVAELAAPLLTKSAQTNVMASLNRLERLPITLFSMPNPPGGVEAFATWINAVPWRCPSQRLLYERYHSLRMNRGDTPKPSDFGDLYHLMAVLSCAREVPSWQRWRYSSARSATR